MKKEKQGYRLKVRKKFGRYFQMLMRFDCCGIFRYSDVGTLAILIKQAGGDKTDLRLRRISLTGYPPVYALFTVGRHPELVDAWGDWQVFRI